MKKKILSISIATAMLLNTSLYASSTISDAMVNVTMPGSYTEHDSSGNVKNYNMYTGGVAYRFNNSSYPPPLYSVSPPSLQANCNGINLKGMFVSLLGLDQLGAMLQNAGASLAWGVAIGLIYSLPGVASAFKMINEWATKLQQLLGNMCQSGINIGMEMAKRSEGYQDMKTKVENWFESPAKKMQEGEGAYSGALGTANGWLGLMSGGGTFGSDGVFSFASDEKMPAKDIKDSFSSLYKGKFFIDNSIGAALFQDFFAKTISNPSVRADILSPILSNAESFSSISVIIQEGDGLTFDTIDGRHVLKLGLDKLASYSSDLNERSNIKRQFYAYAVLYNFVGDIGLKGVPSAKDLQNINAIADGNATDAQIKEVEEKRVKAMQNFPTARTLSGPAATRTTSEAAADFYTYLWLGTEDAISVASKTPDATLLSEQTKNKKILKAPILTVVAYEQEKTPEKAFTTYVPSENLPTAEDFSSENFKGLLPASTCIIENLTKNNTINTCGMAILIPGVDRYIRTIKNSDQYSQNRLKGLLAAYNAKVGALGLLDSILSGLKLSTSGSAPQLSGTTTNQPSNQGTVGTANDGKAEEKLTYSQKVELFIENTKKLINESTLSHIDEKELIRIFKEQDEINQARGLKSNQK